MSRLARFHPQTVHCTHACLEVAEEDSLGRCCSFPTWHPACQERGPLVEASLHSHFLRSVRCRSGGAGPRCVVNQGPCPCGTCTDGTSVCCPACSKPGPSSSESPIHSQSFYRVRTRVDMDKLQDQVAHGHRTLVHSFLQSKHWSCRTRLQRMWQAPRHG